MWLLLLLLMLRLRTSIWFKVPRNQRANKYDTWKFPYDCPRVKSNETNLIESARPGGAQLIGWRSSAWLTVEPRDCLVSCFFAAGLLSRLAGCWRVDLLASCGLVCTK